LPTDNGLIRVFISYSHGSDDFNQQVLYLADQLNAKGGIRCYLDQYEFPAPKEGWPKWMTYQVDQADFILMICTKGYYDKFFRKNKPGTGLGGVNECLLIANRFHNESSASNRYIPILFANDKKEHIPLGFTGHHRYRLENKKDGWDEGQYKELYYHITNQAATPAPDPAPTVQKRPPAKRGAFPKSPKSDDAKEADLPLKPRVATQTIVEERLYEILKSHPKISLVQALRSELEAAGHYNAALEVLRAVVRGLVNADPLASIGYLVRAKRKSHQHLKTSATAGDQNENLQIASDILGWLTLLCVNHQWLDTHHAFLKKARIDSKWEIPSRTKVGASTAYSATVPRKTLLGLDDVNKEPKSTVDIYLNYLHETGFGKQFNLQSILELVYVTLWKNVPYKADNIPSLDDLKAQLAPTIELRKDGEELPVLFINLKPEKGNPIENSALFSDLRHALGSMPIFFLRTESDQKALIVQEPLLENLIIEFYLD